ncbi:hypothetical protein [Peptoniphilus asaccharolyticus]
MAIKVNLKVNGLESFIEKLKELQNLIEEINNETLTVEASYQSSLESTNSSKA